MIKYAKLSAAAIMASLGALALAPTRVKIATASLTGSINLAGGRIDDLRLNDYRETTNANSPTVVLLSHSGAPDAYFVDFGWTGAADAGPLPGRDTLWTAPAGATLTTATPITLTYDNGAGLQFTRTIAVDDSDRLAPRIVASDALWPARSATPARSAVVSSTCSPPSPNTSRRIVMSR